MKDFYLEYVENIYSSKIKDAWLNFKVGKDLNKHFFKT